MRCGAEYRENQRPSRPRTSPGVFEELGRIKQAVEIIVQRHLGKPARNSRKPSHPNPDPL